MSHPNPQAEYGENEIGTPMKPSERIEEIEQELLFEMRGLTTDELVEKYGNIPRLGAKVLAVISYLDEQAAKGKEL